MADVIDNDPEHWVTTLKKGVIQIKKFAAAVNTPVDESEYILKYGKFILNTNTGLFKYGDTTIQMLQSDRIYKVTRILLLARGNEVVYKDIAQTVNLPFESAKGKKETRTKIKVAIRDLRKRLGINAIENKEANPFIMTGKGIKAAFIQ